MFFTKKEQIYYLNPEHKMACEGLGLLLSKYITPDEADGIVVLCIGSDRVTGDSLGPLVGYKLGACPLPGLTVYGSLEQPVHALNLNETIEKIKSTHTDACIIAVDASLGSEDHLGYVTLSKKALRPGAGVDKKLTAIGDIAITGIVNTSGAYEHLVLQTTRLGSVMRLADCIAGGILNFAQRTMGKHAVVYSAAFNENTASPEEALLSSSR